MFFKSKVNKKSAKDILPDKKNAPTNLGDVLILGLGVSGRACVEYLEPLVGSRVKSLTVLENDSKNPKDYTSELADGFDLCIASPGISVFSDFYKSASEVSKRVISEVEFAWGESDKNSVWVAITGTNGKTTTTALCAQILSDADLDAKAVGNIGDACISAVGKGYSHYVAELSSFQLASIDCFAPEVAVMLGIKPDHVEWHKTFEHYASSKMRLLENLADAQGSVVILDATNDEVRAKIREIKNQLFAERGYLYIPLGTSEGITGDMRVACNSANSAFVNEDGTLEIAFAFDEHKLCSTKQMQIKGPHNWVNALAASSAAIALGISDESISKTLETFAALEHRIEPAGEVDGIAFYNDSKATNVDSVLSALTSFPGEKVAILLGGHDKMTPLDDLVSSCKQNAEVVVCFGEAKERFYNAMSPLCDCGITVLSADNISDAFNSAVIEVKNSHPTCKIVILSPACSSYDEFNCFEERGEYFKQLVNAL